MRRARPPRSAVASLARLRPPPPTANRCGIWRSRPDLRSGRRPSPCRPTATAPARCPEGWTGRGALGGAALWNAVSNLPKVPRPRLGRGWPRWRAPPPRIA